MASTGDPTRTRRIQLGEVIEIAFGPEHYVAGMVEADVHPLYVGLRVEELGPEERLEYLRRWPAQFEIVLKFRTISPPTLVDEALAQPAEEPGTWRDRPPML